VTEAAEVPAAEVRGATKTYGGVQALVDVDFTVGPGEVRALLGKNGAGKSTLIRLLSGAETADAGVVRVGGTEMERPSVQEAHRLGVRTVYQELTLVPGLSVAENLFMARWPGRVRIDRRRMEQDARAALERIGLRIDPRSLVEQLSIADRQLVEIARAVHDEPRLLILDEPTSSLAAAEVDRVVEVVRTIQASGVAVVFVSHRVPEIRRVASTATVMRDGRTVGDLDLATTSTAQMVELMLGEASDETERVTEPLVAGPVLVQVRGLRVEPKLHGVDLDVHAGEVLGIAGVLGSGRTELLQVVAGLRPADGGTVHVDGTRVDGRGHARALALGVGLTPEDRKNDGIVPELGLDENLVLSDLGSVSRGGVLSRSRVAAAARKAMTTMSIKAASPRLAVGSLSGGNQQKVVIGRWLHAGSRLLLLDEPTRGVDVRAKAQIYALVRRLAADGRAVVFVSSEMEELNLVCDRVVVLHHGRITAEHRAPAIETDQLLLAAMAES
jgi:ABC-type sugar transport system ATPase subunit